MAPYGTCTAPADGVSVSTLGKCVKDSERRRWALGETCCCKLEQWADRKFFVSSFAFPFYKNAGSSHMWISIN